MAGTSYGVNDPLAVKLWSRKLFEEALKQCWASKFMGKSSNSLIQIKEETQKGPGDRVRVGLRMQLTGNGVQGDATLEGQEEALVTYTDNITIDQLRHAVRSAGKMSEQRVPFSVREEARMGLQDWWADRIDTWFINQVSGNSAVTDVRFTGMQATTAPDTSHIFTCGPNADTTEGSLSATTTFALQLKDIDRAVAKAKTFTTGTNPIIRPVKVNGDDMFVLFIHPYQMYQLRTSNTSTVGNYVDLYKAAMQGGKYGDNPIVTGASFVYNNVIVHEDTRIPNIVSSPASGAKTDFRRGVLCGAQSCLMAFGQDDQPNKMTWVEELFDYENQLGVSAGMIAGMKKSVFNSADFATIAISSYAPSV